MTPTIFYIAVSKTSNDSIFGIAVRMEYEEYRLVKETEKGFWIKVGEDWDSKEPITKWVSKTSKKRFAYPTKKEAVYSFQRRNQRRLDIVKFQVEESEKCIEMAKCALESNDFETIDYRIISKISLIDSPR